MILNPKPCIHNMIPILINVNKFQIDINHKGHPVFTTYVKNEKDDDKNNMTFLTFLS